MELNPDRSGVVASPAYWSWSSYPAHIGQDKPPAWLDMNELHGFVLGRPVRQASDPAQAAEAYAELVVGSSDQRIWEEALNQQIYLGEQNFIDQVQKKIEGGRLAAQTEIPKAQRSQPVSLNGRMPQRADREVALRIAHERSGITMAALAAELGLTAGRISQLIKIEPKKK